MTATSTHTAPILRRRPSGPTRRAARALLPIASGQAIWWWLAPVVLSVVATGWRPAWLDEVTVSLWQFVLYAPVVASFALGVVLVAVHLPLHVANGIDRRSFTRAAAVAAAPAIMASAAVAAIGFAVERAVLVTAVADPALVERHLFTATDQYGLVVVEMLVAIVTAWTAGWLVSVGYYRFGWWRGTLLLVLVLLPTGVVQLALSTGRVLGTDLVLGASGRVAVAMAVVVLMAVVVDRATRGLELRGTSTWQVTG